MKPLYWFLIIVPPVFILLVGWSMCRVASRPMPIPIKKKKYSMLTMGPAKPMPLTLFKFKVVIAYKTGRRQVTVKALEPQSALDLAVEILPEAELSEKITVTSSDFPGEKWIF